MSMQENWWEEQRSAYLYTIMAKVETHFVRKNLFSNLAKAALEQAKVWEKHIAEARLPAPLAFQPDVRTRLVGWLVRLVGVDKIHFILSAMKIRGMSALRTTHHHEGLHRGVTTAGNLRAAVFGVNDGLISNMSLILGFVGANASPRFIILAGLSGLLAGACSMAAGEYVSVRSQRDVFEYQIELEKKELEIYPEEEMEELALIYQARGIPQAEAIKLAELMIKNPSTALDTLAREELGLNPDELGSPTGAMLWSFFSFAFGALIPVLPFILLKNLHAFYVSLTATGCSLFLIGALLSLYTNNNAIKGGLRMLGIGMVAGMLTYFIGKSIGVRLN